MSDTWLCRKCCKVIDFAKDQMGWMPIAGQEIYGHRINAGTSLETFCGPVTLESKAEAGVTECTFCRAAWRTGEPERHWVNCGRPRPAPAAITEGLRELLASWIKDSGRYDITETPESVVESFMKFAEARKENTP